MRSRGDVDDPGTLLRFKEEPDTELDSPSLPFEDFLARDTWPPEGITTP